MICKDWNSPEEYAARLRVVDWASGRWPGCHVAEEVKVIANGPRVDLAFIGVSHYAFVEVKAERDSTTRLVTQLAPYVLATPELWVACHRQHEREVLRLRRLLFPSLGLIRLGDQIEVVAEAEVRQPDAEGLLSVLTRAELVQLAGLTAGQARHMGHAALVAEVEKALPRDGQMRAACAALRTRETLAEKVARGATYMELEMRT